MGERKRKTDSFPFPDRATAFQELEHDPCYPKIPEADRERIVDMAWEKGRRAAEEAFAEKNGEYDFFRICGQSGLKVKEKDIDFISGNQRYFSDYVSGRGEITLYLKSVKVWAEKNRMTMRQAENMILSHEYFHYLEWTKVGLTSRMYEVPMVKVGKMKIGKTGIRALSEIGAHAFARTYHDLHILQVHGKETA